ncbi:zinc dependent phospholipase C family protein [Alkalibaculum sporogenes]|uniref:zinc dependent phospholipase C family protein n=1 Tax=Alkalibaculum sporogenes TaxID=2655001 RepID=UPI00128C6516|nr:zinc dependent phospholipase C family protein [Alkalibaculum sporogenes]
MNLKSHIILANHTADIIEDQIDIKLDRDTLELGAVYPDLHIRKRVRIHNLKQVYNNYFMQTENIINKNKNKWGISFSLGMLSHYVCDSFCLAHNMKMRSINDFKVHRRYENKLSEVVHSYKLDDNVKHRINENFERCMDFDIYDFLGETQTGYIQNANFKTFENQYNKDIEHSIFCSAIVMVGFIYELEKAQSPAVEILYTL